MSEVTEIKREFELERMILFSDAVFAIAITLLAIDIKFPEVSETANNSQILKAMKPLFVHFVGFIISFFFIGAVWWRHLAIFRYLRDYDKGLIARNLVLLFFIACFPFAVSAFTENMRHAFLLPVFIYFTNIAFTFFAQYFICHYIFVTKKDLCYPGKENEKKYLLLLAQYSALIFLITMLVLAAIYFISKGSFTSVVMGLYILPVLMILLKRKIKKIKPTSLKSKA